MDKAEKIMPQIIVVYLKPFEEKYYGELKKFITN